MGRPFRIYILFTQSNFGSRVVLSSPAGSSLHHRSPHRAEHAHGCCARTVEGRSGKDEFIVQFITEKGFPKRAPRCRHSNTHNWIYCWCGKFGRRSRYESALIQYSVTGARKCENTLCGWSEGIRYRRASPLSVRHRTSPGGQELVL